MLLDVQDQEIVDKLPRLSELHEAYGVQVNSIPVSELFDLRQSCSSHSAHRASQGELATDAPRRGIPPLCFDRR